MQVGLSEYLGDIIWVGLSVLVLSAYHAYLGACSRRDPHCTIQRVNRGARHAWVEHIMADPSHAVLAVQTLRNSTMAATFFASTAVLLLMGVLSLSGQADKLADSWHVLNVIGSHHPVLWVFKILALTADLLVAFFSFAMSVRLFNHVGYQVNLPIGVRPPAVTPEQVARHLNLRAGARPIPRQKLSLLRYATIIRPPRGRHAPSGPSALSEGFNDDQVRTTARRRKGATTPDR